MTIIRRAPQERTFRVDLIPTFYWKPAADTADGRGTRSRHSFALRVRPGSLYCLQAFCNKTGNSILKLKSQSERSITYEATLGGKSRVRVTCACLHVWKRMGPNGKWRADGNSRRHIEGVNSWSVDHS